MVSWRYKFDPTLEENVAKWLNCLCEEFSRVTGIPIKRKWVTNACNLGTPFRSRAGMVLGDNASSRTNSPTWGNICAFGELMNQATFDFMTKRIVNTKSDALFTVQETRRFLPPSLAINGGKGNRQEGPQLTLSLVDRQGVFVSEGEPARRGIPRLRSFTHHRWFHVRRFSRFGVRPHGDFRRQRQSRHNHC